MPHRIIYVFAFVVLAFLLYFMCNPNQSTSEDSRVQMVNMDGFINHLLGKKSRTFITAEWCGGCKLTFTNVFLEDRELYENEVFYFGSSSGINHYLVDDNMKVYWISDVTNTPLHHKNALSKVLSSIYPLYVYNWGFPLIFEYHDKRIIEH